MIEPKLTVSDGTVSPCIEIDKRHIEAIAHEYWAASFIHCFKRGNKFYSLFQER